MALSFGVTLLSLAVLLFGISIEISNAKEVCTLQLVDKEKSDSNAEVHDVANTETKYKRSSWQWVCKESNDYKTADYEQEEEEPNRRVRRAWGSRRSSSSSSRSSSRGWGGSRSSSSSSRSSSRGWGGRRSSSSSRGSSRSWGGSRSSSSSSRSSSRGWGGRRSSSSSSRGSSRVWGSKRSSPASRSSSRIWGTRTSSSSSSRGSSRIWRNNERSTGRSNGKRSKQNPKPKSTSQKSAAWDKVHTALDIAGMVPGIGNVADGINAGLHAARGNWKDAALSAAGMIPGAGQAATAAKLAKKSSKAIKGSTKAVKGIKGKLLKESKSLKEFLERAVVTNTKKKGKTIAKTDESYDVAKKIFQKETGVKPKDTGLTHARTKDGKYHLTVRDYSSKGDKTLDVKDVETGHVTKTRCSGGSCGSQKN